MANGHSNTSRNPIILTDDTPNLIILSDSEGSSGDEFNADGGLISTQDRFLKPYEESLDIEPSKLHEHQFQVSPASIIDYPVH